MNIINNAQMKCICIILQCSRWIRRWWVMLFNKKNVEQDLLINW